MILLVQVMPAESKGIAGHERDQHPPPVLQDRAKDEHYQPDSGADEVEPPAVAIAVLAQVERVKVLERAVAAFHENLLAVNSQLPSASTLNAGHRLEPIACRHHIQIRGFLQLLRGLC